MSLLDRMFDLFFLIRLLYWTVGLLVTLVGCLIITSPWLLLSKDPAVDPTLLHPDNPNALHSAVIVDKGTVLISEDHLARGLSEYLTQRGINNRILVHILPGKASLNLTIVTGLYRPFINLELHLVQRQQKVNLDSIKIGKIKIPASVAKKITGFLTRKLPQISDIKLLLAENNVRLISKAIVKGDGNHLIHERENVNLNRNNRAKKRFHDYLTIASQWSKKSNNRLIDLLRTLFQYAYDQSTVKTAVSENQTLLKVAAILVNHRHSLEILGRHFAGGNYNPKIIALQGRHDLAQHFIVAAAISATGNQTLANNLGLFKELSDFDTGSGFSFSDLAADRAGSHFGNLAVKTSKMARQIQNIMKDLDDENSIMPNVTDLPDHLGKHVFDREYGGIMGRGYRKMEELIEHKINACPLYQTYE